MFETDPDGREIFSTGIPESGRERTGGMER